MRPKVVRSAAGRNLGGDRCGRRRVGCHRAIRIWLIHARRAYDWFDGHNDRSVMVGDPVSGTSRDGINPRGLNLNEGAESVLAYQHAFYALQALMAKVGVQRW